MQRLDDSQRVMSGLQSEMHGETRGGIPSLHQGQRLMYVYVRADKCCGDNLDALCGGFALEGVTTVLYSHGKKIKGNFIIQPRLP